MASSSSGASSVNVFAVPHSRMKELVASSLRPESSSSLADAANLQSIYEAMWEFKSHEYIENTFIMDRLKRRLHSRRVYNALVCNCHEDSKLLDVIELIEQVYEARNTLEKETYAKRLYSSIQSFMEDFLHHMEEEEAVFQPLLNENFDASELVDMNETVLRQHSLFRQRVKIEKNLQKAIKRKRKEDCFQDDKELFKGLGDMSFKKSYCQEVADHLAPHQENKQVLKTDDTSDRRVISASISASLQSSLISLDAFPDELLLSVLKSLGPRDLLRCSRVSRRFYRLCLLSGLWKEVRPVQWSKGLWHFEADYGFQISADGGHDETGRQGLEFRVTKGLLRNLLPKMGDQVRTLSLSGAKYASDRSIARFIGLCPNLVSLDLSYTNVGHAAFKDLEKSRDLGALEELSFEGCYRVSDELLRLLSLCFEEDSSESLVSSRSKVKKLNLSGCKLVTSFGMECLDVHRKNLVYLDLSGCYRVDGDTLTEFVLGCPNLRPQFLFYCNDIEDGPYPQEANGCMNLECGKRFCCQQLLN